MRESQFVRKGRFYFFHSPDGQFQLLSYRLSRTVTKPVIWVEAIIDQHKRSRVEYLVKARSQFKSACTANNVVILVPVPPDVDSPKFRTNRGSVEYVPSKNAIMWTISKFEGGREFLLRAHFGLPSTTNEEPNEESKRPIVVRFEIPYFTLSGIQVRYLRIVERGGYKALPWVKYLTRSGDYSFRIA
jgi:AP-1 complex subunit mu